VTVSIDEIPKAAATASFELRNALLDILGDDLVAMWLHGGTTFVDRSARPIDLDVCVIVANVPQIERSPRAWRADPNSRPSRIRAAEAAIASAHGSEVDATYLLEGEVSRGRLPSRAFRQSQRVTDWAIARAHWLAGQYVDLHGPRPGELVISPTTAELAFALDRELEHLERHVFVGDAKDPYEATYAIFNGCRILHTLETGSPVISKRSAGDWGLVHLPRRWQGAILAAGRSYDGVATAGDRETLRGTMSPFVEMVRARLPARRRRVSRPPRWS
jgi:Aminoglycoside adenylyltransferase, C-terminal domain